MTSAGDDGKRHVYGPRPLGALLPMVVRPAFRKRSPAMAQVLADWDVIVGPAIASVAAPRKLFGGTLSIVCSGPMAVELQHLSEQLIGRINGHLGQVAVTRLRFIQDLRRVPAPPPKPRPQVSADASAAVAVLAPGDLRDALEALGRVVLARDRP